MADETETNPNCKKVRGIDGNYLKTLSSEDLNRFNEKLKIAVGGEKISIDNPYEVWNDEEYWSEAPTSWPNIEFGDIWNYLIESPGPFTKEKLKSYKSLLAYDYFISRKVGPISSHEIGPKQSGYTILKAEVRPGQAESQHSHLAWIICTKSGEVVTAHCDCKAG